MKLSAFYEQVWLVDFEFKADAGETPEVHCLVARELFSQQTIKLWADEFGALPPYRTDGKVLFVAYYASAEIGCHLVLDWPVPLRILDLFTEFRCLSNGLGTGHGLLAALRWYGLPSIEHDEKDEMRGIAIRGGPFTSEERRNLIDYCESDVIALEKLTDAMESEIDLPRALLRGRYMAAVAHMENNGTPIDVENLEIFRQQWHLIKGKLTRNIDRDYGVFVPTGQSPIDPDSERGRIFVDTAAAIDCTPEDLADVARQVLNEQRPLRKEYRDAVIQARKTSGLTLRKVQSWENGGRDHSTWIGLDVLAREIAGELPELGIGGGYQQYETYDDTDYAAALWEILREPDPKLPKMTDDEILSEACHRLSVGELDDERPLSFNSAKFANWLIANNMPWPRTESGDLSLSDESFRQMARSYPEVAPLRELRASLGEMKLFQDLAVGRDGRNRCLLSAFRARSSRNAPSTAKFIFGPSAWLRGLIKPEVDRAVAYIDWSQQEFAIAAVLSGDANMVEAYESGDPYMRFAIQAGAAPEDATKATHKDVRAQFKVCALAVQYGMSEFSLAAKLGAPVVRARQLLQAHKLTYSKFWEWSESAVHHATLKGYLWTRFNWRIQIGKETPNPRSLMNFPMQANGAEMLRLACCMATEAGIRVCCPVHDAILIEASNDQIDDVITQTQSIMAEASRIILDGFELRTDVDVVRWPERYMDERGRRMWDEVQQLIKPIEVFEEW